MREFKTESKKLMDMMINSIYTHKEIFLRELISNASDAIDKLYFKSLTDENVGLDRSDFAIRITPDKENRTITIEDNGIGMNAEDLENNLGTIAKSGSGEFRAETGDSENADKIDVIGQFGVGFYSAFMVADRVTVVSRAYGENEANMWESSGVEGYDIKPWEKESAGTVITLHLKENTENDNYDEYLETYRLHEIIKKYSDYIRYPIKMDMDTEVLKEGSEDEYETIVEEKTVNSMIPLWKKAKSEISDEEYNEFYKENFWDYADPAHIIHSRTEGTATYSSLLFIPAHTPFDYYSKDYKKGLKLFSKGVLISDSCEELLPDYFGFVKGLVDSEDLSLNISREMLQHDHQLKLIARTIEKKIKSELKKLMTSDREKYEKIYSAFATQFKYGIYNDYGKNKDNLKDLLMFESSFKPEEKEGEYTPKYTTLDEYIARMKDGQEKIFYASGETKEKIDMLPQTEAVLAKGYELLYLTEYVDEFAVKMLIDYEGKSFCNIASGDVDLGDAGDKEKTEQANKDNSSLLDEMNKALDGQVSSVRFTDKLSKAPACLSSEGEISVEMEKILSQMPDASGVKATLILEINMNHPIADTLKAIHESDDGEKLTAYTKLLYTNARITEGMSIENPAEFSDLLMGVLK